MQCDTPRVPLGEERELPTRQRVKRLDDGENKVVIQVIGCS